MEPLAELAKHVVPSLSNASHFLYNKWRAIRLSDTPTLVLPTDAALILGEMPAFGVSAFYAFRENVLPEGVFLLGNDLTTLGPATSFAKIVFVKLRNFYSYGKPGAFTRIQEIKDLDKTLNMEGVMVNDSPFDFQETILIKRNSLKHLSFEAIGDAYINLYKTCSEVDKVTVVFVSDPTYQYAELKKQAALAAKTLEAMVFFEGKKDLDCNACPKKSLCLVVPGLKELHSSLVK